MTIEAVRQSPAVRWLPAEPFAHLDDIHHRTSRGLRALTAASTPGGEPPPGVDVEETADEFVIEVDLPGAAGVIVEWNARYLVVHGRIPERAHTGPLRRHTRRTGPVHYAIALPAPVQGDKITATVTNGVLTIHAPKAHPGPAVYIIDADASEGQLP
ncbi:Hsp20/alpha crystallin family protein [Kribbella sp.]|uniref:Hsp20/alpha crystallin family protein n=1 Tax=Kribbella sp. TaxID=1871183 RepID=UPI002D227687|nr:Hsp20/alpha crystallin family protein [Kribbella sp.]HZX05005.1 Hsp20/alpha crystallin family protein [Kribbella sp.]